MADSSWVLVDDRDPGIAYASSGGQVLHGGVSQEYMKTTTGLSSGATATYYFNASSIAVYGTYGPAGGSAGAPCVTTYQVDSNPPVTVTGPTTQVALYRQNFWTSSAQLSSLAPGAFHQLIINSTTSNNTLWIDYLAYPPASTATTATTAATTATTSSAGASSSTLSTSSKTDVGSQTGSPSGTSNTGTSVSILVAGVVVGTLAFILASAALLIYMWNRRSKANTGELPGPGESHVASPVMSQNHHSPSDDSRFYWNVPQRASYRGDVPRVSPLVPARAFDGGVAVMGSGPTQTPPGYQEHH